MSRLGQIRYLWDKRLHYRKVFDPESRSARVVLGDLRRRFKRVDALAPTTKTRNIDPLALAWLNGGQEVWNYIESQLTMDPQRLAEMESAELERRATMEQEDHA